MSDQTLAKLARNREKLLALVADLSEEQLDTRSAEGWTIRETLTHLLNAEEDHAKIGAVIARGETDRLPPPLELDAYNARRLHERGHLNRADLLAALNAQRERTVALYRRLSEDQLAISGRHPVLGEMTVENIFRIIGIHEQQHIREIQALVETS